MSDYREVIRTTASIDYPLYQSQLGNYFIGETPLLNGQNTHALSSLMNPQYSRKVLYVNAITITNLSGLNNLIAVFYLGAALPNAVSSTLVSCTNTALSPTPAPTGMITYLPEPNTPPVGSVPIFSRIVPPDTTLVVDGGQIILGQNKALNVYISGLSEETFEDVRLAYGWWEEPYSSLLCP